MILSFISVHIYKSLQIKLNKDHVVVVFRNGQERSGLFCLVANLVEKIEAGLDTSIVSSLMQVRTYIPSAVPTLVNRHTMIRLNMNK